MHYDALSLNMVFFFFSCTRWKYYQINHVWKQKVRYPCVLQHLQNEKRNTNDYVKIVKSSMVFWHYAIWIWRKHTMLDDFDKIVKDSVIGS